MAADYRRFFFSVRAALESLYRMDCNKVNIRVALFDLVWTGLRISFGRCRFRITIVAMSLLRWGFFVRRRLFQ
jgi:hypothetical protein